MISSFVLNSLNFTHVQHISEVSENGLNGQRFPISTGLAMQKEKEERKKRNASTTIYHLDKCIVPFYLCVCQGRGGGGGSVQLKLYMVNRTQIEIKNNVSILIVNEEKAVKL